MAEVVDELLVKLGLETDAKGFQQANNQFASLRSTALKLGAALAGGVGFHDLTVGVAAARDELGKWAKDAGVSIQFADKLRHAMEKFGGTDADSRGLIDVANNLREAAKWGELAQRSFTSRGFNPQRIQQENMSVEETIDFISRGLSNIKDRDERNRIAESMGINNPFTRNMLSDYGGMQAEFKRAEELGLVTEEITKNAAAFNDAVTDASRAARTLKDTIANHLLPDLADVINDSAGWITSNREEIGDAIQEAMPYLKATATGIAVLVAAQTGKKGIAMLAGAAATNGPAAAVIGLGAFYMDEKNRNDASSSFTGGVRYQLGEWRRRLGISGPMEQPKAGDGPLALKSIFGALIQQESGGRHYGPDGQLLRSGAGALGITQIMPATARNPGYGISPLANDSKEEYLRVGREYFYAMVKEFDGDTQKALAAYNAGPGTVRKAVDLAGSNWLAAMPGETQAYVPSIMGRAGASGTTNYYSIDARGSTDPAATEAAVRRVVDERIQNAAQISRDDFPNNVE